MVQEELVLLKHVRDPDYSGDLEAYKGVGGFKALEKVLGQMKPPDVVEFIKEAGLRGRGGAGFPTGMKWSFMPQDSAKPCYLICNADESEPGTFKDHLLMHRDPHQFLEGMIIGCYALNCHHGYIYIRGESEKVIRHMQEQVNVLYDAGLLGKNILGSGFDLDLTIHSGAGAYICGEETALLDSLEGKRGQPRFKPPFPAQAGFEGCPTTVNNVETLTCVPYIINQGAEAFQALGTPNNAGTHLVSISGHVNKPGVYEVRMGEPLRGIIEDLAGGIRGGKQVKAVIPGGASAAVLRADEIDVAYDFDSLMKIGTMMGSSAVMVFDEDTDVVDIADRTIRFFNHESCGQCTPCREGTFWLRRMVRDFLDDNGDDVVLERMDRVAGNIIGTTICAFGDAVGGPMRAFVQKFPEEFRQHFGA